MSALAQPAPGSDARGVSIEVAGVRMVFERDGRKVEALSEVSLAIPAGRFCAVLGPSGCGKSTLMMLVVGLYRPSAGRVLLDGAALEGCYTDAGIVFQSDVLLPWLTVLDNVMLPATVKKLPRAAALARAHELLARVGLSGFEEHYPSELSGGMRQRASICRALLHEPSVLLMDEPFGALDALTREQMRLDLEALWLATRKTVLFITHSIDEAVLLADRVVVMSPRPGRIEQVLAIDLPRPRGLDARRATAFVSASETITDIFLARGVLHGIK
jgi:NitT/TauT family transport system ATP-binding protein